MSPLNLYHDDGKPQSNIILDDSRIDKRCKRQVSRRYYIDVSSILEVYITCEIVWSQSGQYMRV